MIDSSTSLRGKIRFDYLMSHSNRLPGEEGYDEWLLNFKEDPTDPEFNALIEQAKSAAAQRIAARTRRDEKSSIFPVVEQPVDSEIDRELRGTPVASDQQGRRSEHIRDQVDAHGNIVNAPDTPIIQGLPVGAENTLSGDAGQANNDSQLSSWVKQWANDQDLKVNVDDTATTVRTGEYVYVGEQQYAATSSEAGYTRPIYVYKDDAKASVTNMNPDDIKAIQTSLGLPVTGLVDKYIQSMWDEAVEMGQGYARAGNKVDLKFLFDSVVQAKIAGGGFGGGGGGGAASTVDDYYFTMMRVLGDISGVKA